MNKDAFPNEVKAVLNELTVIRERLKLVKNPHSPYKEEMTMFLLDMLIRHFEQELAVYKSESKLDSMAAAKARKR